MDYIYIDISIDIMLHTISAHSVLLLVIYNCYYNLIFKTNKKKVDK